MTDKVEIVLKAFFTTYLNVIVASGFIALFVGLAYVIFTHGLRGPE
jgi:hypothetical protein